MKRTSLTLLALLAIFGVATATYMLIVTGSNYTQGMQVSDYFTVSTADSRIKTVASLDRLLGKGAESVTTTTSATINVKITQGGGTVMDEDYQISAPPWVPYTFIENISTDGTMECTVTVVSCPAGYAVDFSVWHEDW